MARERVQSPSEQVSGIVEDPDMAERVVDALVESDVDEADIAVIGGDEALTMVDPDGSQHGVAGRVARGLERYGQEGTEHDAAAQELTEGRLLLTVHVAGDEDKERVASLLREHGVQRLRYWGRWSVEEL